MDDRLKRLLALVVDEAIRTGEPVGSQHLVESRGLDVSSATVRNWLSELERDGYLVQPHTSSGRMPTEKGYRFYIDELMRPAPVSAKERRALEQVLAAEDADAGLKAAAKLVAEWTGSAMVLGLRRADTYYTGLSLLFAQPEFRDASRVVSLGEVLDRLDDVLTKLRQRPWLEPTVLIGQECPFGDLCACVLMDAPGKRGLICAFGPLRMPYDRHLGLLAAIGELGS